MIRVDANGEQVDHGRCVSHFGLSERLGPTKEEQEANLKMRIAPTVRTFVEIGYVDEVSKLIDIYGSDATATGDEELIEAFSQAEEWLVGARAHEALHGAGSMLDTEHPTYLRTSNASRQLDRVAGRRYRGRGPETTDDLASASVPQVRSVIAPLSVLNAT